MRSKWLRLLAALLAFVLIAAACGDDDDDPVATGEDEAAEEEAAEEEAAEEEAAEEEATEEEAAEEEAAEEEEAAAEPEFDPAVCGERGEPNGESGATPGEIPEGAGGTLIWAPEQEPPDMHLDDPSNNLTATAWARQALLDGLYGLTAETSFYPELLAQEATVNDNGDGSYTLDYVLRDGLTWSDGIALTSRDVQYTCRIILDPDYLIGDRTGYDLITSFDIASDTEFSITYSAFFAGHPSIFEEIYPSHALGETGAEANDNWREFTSITGDPLPSSGPMKFVEWDRGVKLTMERNELYPGSTSPSAQNNGLAYVDGVEMVFVPDTDAQINALLAGEGHVINAQPQLAFEQLATSEDFTVLTQAGPVFEHWGMNLLNPHLSDPLVREAMALAMNKAEVMEGLYTPIFGDALPAEGLGNTYWMSNQPAYVDNAGAAGYGQGNTDAARANLEAAGYDCSSTPCTHPERGALSLRVGTTGGNELRELQQQLLQARFGDAGIEITIDNVPGSDYFSERPFSEEAIAAATSGGAEGDPTIWDVTQFAWVGGPWPGGQSASYLTGNGNNPYGYANPDFDARSVECDATVDDAERADCYNELDKYVTTLEIDPNGLFMMPITQKPNFFGCLTSVLDQCGVGSDGNDAGPLSHVFDYRFGS